MPSLTEQLKAIIAADDLSRNSPPGLADKIERLSVAAMRHFDHVEDLIAAERALNGELRDNLPEILAALRAAQHADALAGVVEWYADTFCEHGKYSEVCGRLDDDQCSGCKARAALVAYRSVK